MTRRRLTEDEVALWRQVADTTERLRPSGSPLPPIMPKPKPRKPVQSHIPDFSLGSHAPSAMPGHDLLPPVADRVAKAPITMDRKTFGKLKRGKLIPEGKLDLHGMTMDRAHPRLTSFIMKAHADGKRLVLVITGKGRHGDDGGPIPVRHGILRHQVPQWLSTPPLSQMVLQVAQAHLKHGGGGAYYVYLRRQR